MDLEDDDSGGWHQQMQLETHERELIEELEFLTGVVLRLIHRIKTIEEELKRD